MTEGAVIHLSPYDTSKSPVRGRASQQFRRGHAGHIFEHWYLSIDIKG